MRIPTAGLALALALAPVPAAALDPVASPAIIDDTLPPGDDPSAQASRTLARAARLCLAEQGRMLGRAMRQGFALDDGGPAVIPRAHWNRSYVLHGIEEREASLAYERDALSAPADAPADRVALLKACLDWSGRSAGLLRRMVGGWEGKGLPGRLREVREAATPDHGALRAMSEGKSEIAPEALSAMVTNRPRDLPGVQAPVGRRGGR